MADHRGVLTPEDHEKITRWWLGGHWKGPVECVACKTVDQWAVADHLVSLHRHAADALAHGSPTYVMVQVGCINCGHTMLFNASRIGVGTPYDPAVDTGLNPQNPRLPGSGAT
jgi:hypothetical protein